MRKGKKKANKQENQKAHEKADAHRSDKAEHALPLMLDRKQLLAHFHIDPHKLYALMKRDELPFPRPKRIGRKNFWITSEVIEWLRKQPEADLKPVPGLKGYRKPEEEHAAD